MEVNIWQTCFICCTNTDKNAKDIFTSNSLSDGTTLQDVISEVTDKPCLKGIDRNTVHSSVICEPCHDRLIDYHVMKLKLNAIKMRMTEDFSATTRKFNVNYSLSTAVIAACGKLPPPPPLAASAVRRLVLPASKLKPLPPDYVIVRPNQMPIKAGLQTPMKILSSRSLLSPNKNPPPVFAKIAPKQPVDPKPQTRTIDNQKKKTTNNSKLVLDATAVSGNSIASIFNKVTSDSMLKFNTNLPSNFMDGKVGSDGGERSGDSDDHGVDAGNQDDQSMEIDEECSAVTIQKHNTRNFQEIFLSAANKEQNLEIATETQEHSYTFESLPNLDATDENEPNEQETKFVIGKVEVMEQESNDTNGDEATIIMQDDDGSLIRMISGDKFMYGDNEISLIMPEDVSQGTDNPDSNDESQIELQVSGDEETANAIIAAAKEQGGAFIKVESGAVYRVNSVESKVGGDLIDLKNDIVEQQGDSYKCLICKPSEDPLKPQFSCEGAKDMLSHIKEAHEMRAYVCAICGLFMKKRTEYSSHINKHREDASDRKASKKLKDSCKPSSSASQQGQDQANNAEGKPYTCEICQKGFVTRYTHQAHLKIHADRPRHFKCDKCSKSFFTFHHLQQHLKTHTASKDFVCKICDKAFGTQHNLQVHGVVHSGQRPYMCGVCEKCFARKAEIRDHMRTHTGERPFSCDICGASFSQRSNLQSHVRATHMNDRRHACDMCDRRFKRRRLLEYHKKAMHTGERPFQCGVCRATFVYPEHFKKHIRIHSGQKPFTCEVCGKSFNSRDNRNAHRFVHSDKKPYECLVCGAGFMRKPQLYAHMNTANHLTESIVVNQPRVSQGSDNEECLETVEEIEPKPEVPTAQDNEDALFTLTRNLESDTETEKGGETAVVGDGTEQNVHVVASDEGGGMVRLVQIQLPNGGKGWLAIN